MTKNTTDARPDLKVSERNLFAGWAAGHYELPSAVVAAASSTDKVNRLPESVLKVARTAVDDRTGVKARQAAARRIAGGADPIGEAADLERAEAEAATIDRAAGLWRSASDIAEAALMGVIVEHADQVIGSLADAYWATLEGVREIAPHLAGVDLGDVRSMAAHGPAASRAYLALAEAGSRMSAILAAQQRIRIAADRGREDRHRFFADTFADPRRTVEGLVPAGPASALPRLIWLATDASAAPWFPGLDEWDTRYRDWQYRGNPQDRPERVAAAAERKAISSARLDAAVDAAIAEKAAKRAEREAADPSRLAKYPGPRWSAAGF